MSKQKNYIHVYTIWHTYKGEIFSFTYEKEELKVNQVVTLFTNNGEKGEPYEYGEAVIIEKNRESIYTAKRI